MNGVLCAGNKEETNYVIIQLLLVCHSQIKCQIKVRGPQCLFNGVRATCSRVWQQGGMAVKKKKRQSRGFESAGIHSDWMWCCVTIVCRTFSKCSQTQMESCLPKLTLNVHSGGRPWPGHDLPLLVNKRISNLWICDLSVASSCRKRPGGADQTNHLYKLK